MPQPHGREWLRKTELMIERMRSARESIPAERMIDVQYDDMDNDWRSSMVRIYRFLDLDIAPALPGMEAYIARTAESKRVPHSYSLEEFGLGEGEVYERLGEYARTYRIPVEGNVRAARPAIAAG